MISAPNYVPDFNFKIPHRNWNRAFSEAYSLLSYADPGEVICITGPSRAGKSRLIREITKLLCGQNDFEETGKLPVVYVTATNSGSHGTFSTKSFTHRLLEAVSHPIYSSNGLILDQSAADRKVEQKTEGMMRIALERALLARETKYLVIDEGQHATYVSKTSVAAHAVMDSWKCLAEDAKLTLVLVGAYPILDGYSKLPSPYWEKVTGTSTALSNDS